MDMVTLVLAAAASIAFTPAESIAALAAPNASRTQTSSR